MESSQYPTENSGNNNIIEDGKTIAIIAYITIIGLIIAFIMNSEKKNDFAKFHIRQSLGIFLCLAIIGILRYIPWIGGILSSIGALFLVIFWVIGLFNAIGGNKKPVPIIGEHINNFLAGI